MADQISFEMALAELETIVKLLEGGNITLDESLKQFKKGCELIELCNEKLKNAKLIVDELSATLDDTGIEGEKI